MTAIALIEVLPGRPLYGRFPPNPDVHGRERNVRFTSTPAVRFAEIGLLTRKDRCNDFRCQVDQASGVRPANVIASSRFIR
jgi:hypothetical protein